MSSSALKDTEDRFGFGENWTNFLELLDDQRIAEAEQSLLHYLKVDDLAGQNFLDIGSGSGLFSLAARRLGANVTSFDFDPQSVACTRELKRRYFENDDQWRVSSGSALDRPFLEQLGKFDIVYSWGVLHHTGAMWLAIENALDRVRDEGGRFFIAIYNDQGLKSHVWWLIKWFYSKLPGFLRKPYVFLIMAVVRTLVLIKYTLRLQPQRILRTMFDDRRRRGMSGTYDNIDWVGGFPYEFAGFDLLVSYMNARGFDLIESRRDTGLGCHEVAFTRR